MIIKKCFTNILQIQIREESFAKKWEAMVLLILLTFSGFLEAYTHWDVLKEINDYVVFVFSICLNFD